MQLDLSLIWRPLLHVHQFVLLPLPLPHHLCPLVLSSPQMKTMMKRTACLNTSYHWVGVAWKSFGPWFKIGRKHRVYSQSWSFHSFSRFPGRKCGSWRQGPGIVVNGKVLTDAALEQRLRRFTTPKKGGKLKSGQEVKESVWRLEQEGWFNTIVQRGKTQQGPGETICSNKTWCYCWCFKFLFAVCGMWGA